MSFSINGISAVLRDIQIIYVLLQSMKTITFKPAYCCLGHKTFHDYNGEQRWIRDNCWGEEAPPDPPLDPPLMVKDACCG